MNIKKTILLFLIIIFCFRVYALPLTPEDKKIVIAVVDFRNTGGDKSLNYLEKTIPENIITRMAKSGQTEIVERSRLQEALTEMELGISGIIDEQSAIELGRAVGATAILLGSFASIERQIRINARLIDVRTSRIIKAEVVQGSVSDDIFRLMDQLAISMESQLLNKKTNTIQFQPIPITERPVVKPQVRKRRSMFKSPVFWTVMAAGVGGGVLYYSQMSKEEKEKLATVKIIFNLP